MGQTGRTLGQRVKEHQHSVEDKKMATSAFKLAKHTQRTGHTIDWTRTEVLDSCTHTKEMLS